MFAAIKKVKRLPQGHKVRLALSFTSLSCPDKLMGLERGSQEATLVHREIALMKLVYPHPHLVELFDVYETSDDLSVTAFAHYFVYLYSSDSES